MSSILRRSKGLVLLAVFGLALGIGTLASQQATAAPVLSPHVVPLTVASHLPPQISAKCSKDFLGLRPWYHYLDGSISSGCDVVCFNIFEQTVANDCHHTRSDVPGLLLALIDDFLRIAGLVAVAFVLVGAFQFVESRGNSERTAQAQSTIINALAGLVVALVAVGFVGFLGNRLGGSNSVETGNLPNVPATAATIQVVLRIVFGIIGAFALLGIALSGLKYIRSAGDSGKTSEAKNGIIYSLIGLAVAISAQALVAFVVSRT